MSKNTNNTNLLGQTFGYLEVIEKANSKKRGRTTRTRWKCLCKRCSNVVDIYADSLLSGLVSSCGCLRKDKEIPDKIKEEFIDGTQISKIQSKVTKANKSGVVGVNWDKSRNKWQASIRFRGHKYNLGRFTDFDEACKVRKEAEEKIFGEFLEWYESNKQS